MHTFNIEDTPLQTFIRRFGMLMSIFIRDFSFMEKDNKIRRFSNIVEKTRADIIQEYVKSIIEFTINSKKIPNIEKYVICPLTMDFSNESKIKNFIYQIKKLEEALNEKEWTQFEFKPFLGINFSNKNNTHFLQKYIKKGLFYGIKLYPPLGFNVKEADDSTVLKYAEDNRIPVTVHCSSGGFPSMHISRRTARKFTHPENWFYVLDKMPELKLNLAHMGGLKNSWVREIKKLCSYYNNVYTDISYIICNYKKLKRKYNDFCKDKLNHKILFGTDWFMSSMEAMTITKLCNSFIDNIGKDDIINIMDKNPKKFLS